MVTTGRSNILQILSGNMPGLETIVPIESEHVALEAHERSVVGTKFST
jgi:hypothetical protein